MAILDTDLKPAAAPVSDPAKPSTAGRAASKGKVPGARRGHRKQVRISGAGVDLHFGEAENPYFNPVHAESTSNPRRIKVARNSNESPLVRMETRNAIDPRQARAGHMVRALFERVMSGPRSSSFISERVDGGQISGGLTERRTQAAHQLKSLADGIGMTPFRLLMMVCGEGRSLADVTRVMKRRKESVSVDFKAALDLAAEHLGLSKARR